MYNSAKPLRPAEEMPRHQQNAVGRRRRLARRIREDWDERYLPELNDAYAWMAAIDPAPMGRDEAVAAWDALWRRHKRAWTIHMLVTAAAYTVNDEFRQVYEELVGGPALDAFAATQALAPALQRLEADLAALTEKARASRPVAEAIARGAMVHELRAADPSFGRALDAFLAAHGHLGQASEGLGNLSWSDDPSLFLSALRLRLLQPPADHEARLSRQRRDADEIVRRAREHLAGRAEDLARFEEVLAAVTSAGPLTEEHNYWLDRRNQAEIGRAVRRFGARLVRDGALRDADEIFLLYLTEVREALQAPADLSALIAERRTEQRRWEEMESPETIGARNADRSVARVARRRRLRGGRARPRAAGPRTGRLSKVQGRRRARVPVLERFVGSALRECGRRCHRGRRRSVARSGGRARGRRPRRRRHRSRAVDPP